jgi:hypothetical protein
MIVERTSPLTPSTPGEEKIEGGNDLEVFSVHGRHGNHGQNLESFFDGIRADKV